MSLDFHVADVMDWWLATEEPSLSQAPLVSPLAERRITVRSRSNNGTGVSCRSWAVIGAVLVLVSSGLLAQAPAISDVAVSRPFFNPSLGQKIGISFNLSQPGKLTVLILDRDGVPVRKLVSEKAVEKGRLAYDWDGRDDRGEAAPDEAYSLKVDLADGGANSARGEPTGRDQELQRGVRLLGGKVGEVCEPCEH